MESQKRTELILKYTPVVRSHVQSLLGKNPSLKPHEDDLVGEGNLKLIDVVDRFLSGKIQQFEVYLRLSIMRAFVDYLRGQSLMPVRSKNRPIVDFKNMDQISYFPSDNLEFQETVDVLLGCIKDRKDALIVQYRAEGASQQKIANLSGIPYSTVRYRISRLEKRYEQETSKNLRGARGAN